MKSTAKTTPDPAEPIAGAGLPRSQGRRGGSNGVQGTDASRAEPGLSSFPEAFVPDRAPLELQVMGDKLASLVDKMSECPDRVSASGVHFGINDIEKQCRQIRLLIPRLNNDFPLCVGDLLDMTA